MASLLRVPSGNWHVHFRFAGRRFKRSLGTADEDEALGLKARIEDNIRLTKRGVRSIPRGADVFLFLLSDGQVEHLSLPDQLTLEGLVDEYKRAVGSSVEESTLYTIGIHTAHLVRLLGKRFDPRTLRQEDLQGYIAKREREKSNRGTAITPTTIRKEIATLRGIWSWAPESYQLGPFPGRKLRYGKTAEKPPFQTWKEIESQVRRGGLTEEQQARLWDCLFLSLAEVSAVLRDVKKARAAPFLYPMLFMAAHTGARRSELLRSETTDFQDDAVVIREAKRVKGQRSTRSVPLSRQLKRVMREWLKKHPGGPATFCFEGQPVTKSQAHDHLKRALGDTKWGKIRGWHVFRHSFISNCALKGIDQRLIDSFVGHTTEEMRRRYTHLFPSARRDAIRTVFG